MAVRLLAWKGQTDARGGEPNLGHRLRARKVALPSFRPSIAELSPPTPAQTPSCRLDDFDHKVIESHGVCGYRWVPIRYDLVESTADRETQMTATLDGEVADLRRDN